MEKNERISLDLIKEVGEDVASMYGGELKTYKIYNTKQLVVYTIVEHGETFECNMTFDEIKEW